MPNTILEHIKSCKLKGEKLLAILLDPDKIVIHNLSETISKIETNNVDYILVGGSTVENGLTDIILKKIKKLTTIPIILFPGDFSQISNTADALLFLSLISGRNPEYLIGQQVKSVNKLKETSLEIIPTGYILIDGGVKTSVQKVSNTTPISQSNMEDITMTAMAGELMGKQLIYLEAGSGATKAVSQEIIKKVSENISIPLIVGGGIRSKKQLENAYQNGADMIVIGTAFEKNNNILTSIL
jgi:phosphoglycerol geranylgeranyltransferase